MDNLLFSVIAVAATLAFLAGVISGIWPVLLVSLCFALLILWAAGRLRL